MGLVFDDPGLGGDAERVVLVQDAPTRLRAIISVHSTARGPAFGGIRRRRYASDVQALEDARRLSAMMSLKCAMADLPAGGGKTVVLDAPNLDTRGAYGHLGHVIESLGGRYVCGPDVGTGDAELAHVRQATQHVNPEGNDASRSTTLGVVAGLKATVARLGLDGLEAASYVVQGLGSVGLEVARTLVDHGATVYGTDLDPGSVAQAKAVGVKPVAVDQALSTACDVLVPCALGGVLTHEVASGAPFRAVCGSANNQLADASVADALHRAGVLYAPDFVVNAGAVTEGVFTVLGGATDEVRAKAHAHIATVEPTLAKVFDSAEAQGRSPHHVAMEQALRRLRPTDGP